MNTPPSNSGDQLPQPSSGNLPLRQKVLGGVAVMCLAFGGGAAVALYENTDGSSEPAATLDYTGLLSNPTDDMQLLFTQVCSDGELVGAEQTEQIKNLESNPKTLAATCISVWERLNEEN